MDEYENLAESNLIPLHEDPGLPQKLVGSFRVSVGERQDEVITPTLSEFEIQIMQR